jgi:hypothetical protein
LAKTAVMALRTSSLPSGRRCSSWSTAARTGTPAITALKMLALACAKATAVDTAAEGAMREWKTYGVKAHV